MDRSSVLVTLTLTFYPFYGRQTIISATHVTQSLFLFACAAHVCHTISEASRDTHSYRHDACCLMDGPGNTSLMPCPVVMPCPVQCTLPTDDYLHFRHHHQARCGLLALPGYPTHVMASRGRNGVFQRTWKTKPLWPGCLNDIPAMIVHIYPIN